MLDCLSTFQTYLEETADSLGPVERDATRATTAAIVKLKMRLRDTIKRRAGQDLIALTSGEAKNPGPPQLELARSGQLGNLAHNIGVSGGALSAVLGAAGTRGGQKIIKALRDRAAEHVAEWINPKKTKAAAIARTPRPRPTRRLTTQTVTSSRASTTQAARAKPTPKPTAHGPAPPSKKTTERSVAVHNRAKRPAVKQIGLAAGTTVHATAPARAQTMTVRMPKNKEEAHESAVIDFPIFELIKDTSVPDTDLTYHTPTRNADLALQGWRMQPGDGTMGDQVKALAAPYQFWRATHIEFMYEAAVGTGTNGKVYLVYDPRGGFTAPRDIVNIDESCAYMDCQPFANCSLPLSSAVLSKVPGPGSGGWRKVRRNEYFDGDRALFDGGVVWCMSQYTTGVLQNTLLGRVTMRVHIEFKCLSRLALPWSMGSKTAVFRLDESQLNGSVLASQSLSWIDATVGDLANFVAGGGATLSLQPGIYLCRATVVVRGTLPAATPGGIVVTGGAVSSTAEGAPIGAPVFGQYATVFSTGNGGHLVADLTFVAWTNATNFGPGIFSISTWANANFGVGGLTPSLLTGITSGAATTSQLTVTRMNV